MRIFWKAYKLILEGKNKFGQIWWEMAENMANMHFHALEEFRRPKKGFWRRKKNWQNLIENGRKYGNMYF